MKKATKLNLKALQKYYTPDKLDKDGDVVNYNWFEFTIPDELRDAFESKVEALKNRLKADKKSKNLGIDLYSSDVVKALISMWIDGRIKLEEEDETNYEI